MKISIIVPIYNSERYIERLIKSVLMQNYENYELILIDDGSTDNSYDIIKKYENENVKILTKKNEGVGITRKLGFKLSTGDLIFFCDSDDYLAKNNVLEKINNIFMSKNIDILMFDALDITKNNKFVVNTFSKDMKQGYHKVEEINDCFLYGPLFLKVFKKNKLDDSCFALFNNFEDTYTTYMYLNKCENFYYENDVYYVYDETANENSLTKTKTLSKFIKTISLIKKMSINSKLKGSCIISAFNYYLYMIDVLNSGYLNTNECKKLEKKMNVLENIFIEYINHIRKYVSKEKVNRFINYKNKKLQNKIILIDGISTTGKSTLSNMLQNQLRLNFINVKWMHEEAFNEINLLLEMSKKTAINKDIVYNEMSKLLKRWELFYNKIKNDDFVYILDSNFFKNIHDYLLYNDLTFNEIKSFYNEILSIIKEDVLFIFLKRENIKKSFIDSFKNRGTFWEKSIKKSYIPLKYKDEDDKEPIFEFECFYQKICEKLVEDFNVNKLSIITDDENWDEYLDIILKRISLRRQNEKAIDYDYIKYIGEYFCDSWNVNVYFDSETKKLFMSSFWPKIELKYIGDDTFKLDKFPLQVKFEDDGLIFFGDLIWEMKDKKFIRKKEPVKILKKD